MEMVNILESEAVVKSAKKDFSKLRNVDRPLYDLLLTNDSGRVNNTQRSRIEGRQKMALLIGEDHLIGDIPRLDHNLEESSFLAGDDK
jgi:hypothetical protein